MKKSKITIHDIARELNIDSSTVSRALNNDARVKQKTKDLVNSKAVQLGYQRNMQASNLRSRKTSTIGVIVPRISRHFFSSAIAGIEETAYDSGYTITICQSLEQFERELKIVHSLSSNRVDGVLISVSMETKDASHLEIFKNSGTPVVFFDRAVERAGSSSVVLDDFKGGFDATEHLIVKGCRHIAHFSGPQRLEIYKSRFQGYKAALKKHGLKFDPRLVIRSKLMEGDGIACTEKLLSLATAVDGIFSANDTAAISAVQLLKEKNIRIPQDIAVVGFSNEPVSAAIEPSLTTIDQPGFEMGKTALMLLLAEIKSKAEAEPQTILLEPRLLVRQSSKRSG